MVKAEKQELDYGLGLASGYCRRLKFTGGNAPVIVHYLKMDNNMLIPPVDGLNDFISKVFIAIAIGALVFGISLFLATLIYPHFLK